MNTTHHSAAPIATEVLKRGPARFNMVGQRLPYHLHTVDEFITAGLAHRLAAYATRRMADGGFAELTAGWKITVYTIDGEDRPAERSYCVRWQNKDGGYIEVVGILTRSGWPSLDHGYAIGQE
jgi:hypothetical protein